MPKPASSSHQLAADAAEADDAERAVAQLRSP